MVAAGAAAAGGLFALLNARSTFDDAQKNGCPGANSKTYCDSKANSVDSAITLSKIFFVGAGLLRRRRDHHDRRRPEPDARRARQPGRQRAGF